METIENGFKSGDLISKTLLFSCGQVKTGTSENGDKKVWIGENDTKKQVWMKIFCFVFAEMKTDIF